MKYHKQIHGCRSKGVGSKHNIVMEGNDYANTMYFKMQKDTRETGPYPIMEINQINRNKYVNATNKFYENTSNESAHK